MIYHQPPYVLKLTGAANLSVFTAGMTFGPKDADNYNNPKKYPQDHRIYADMFEVHYNKQTYAAYFGSSASFLGGLDILFKHIGPNNPITNPIHWKFIHSVFGNGAKLKLAEFKTPAEIENFLKNEPIQVIQLMTGTVIPVRKRSEIEVWRKQNADEVNKRYKYDYGVDKPAADLKKTCYPPLMPWQFIEDTPAIVEAPAKEAKKDEPAAQPSVAAPAPQASDAGVTNTTAPEIPAPFAGIAATFADVRTVAQPMTLEDLERIRNTLANNTAVPEITFGYTTDTTAQPPWAR